MQVLPKSKDPDDPDNDNRKQEPKSHSVIGRDSAKNPQSRDLINLVPTFGLRLSPRQSFNSILCHKTNLVTLSLSGHHVEL